MRLFTRRNFHRAQTFAITRQHFQFFSDRYERASVALTSNLAFAQWTQVFGNEQMTAALLDRLVHRSHILTMEGESFRFRQSLQKQDPSS